MHETTPHFTSPLLHIPPAPEDYAGTEIPVMQVSIVQPTFWRIFTSVHMTEQYRLPRTKRKRMRKKWAKNPFNWRPRRTADVCPEARFVICHPHMEAAYRAACRIDNPRRREVGTMKRIEPCK